MTREHRCSIVGKSEVCQGSSRFGGIIETIMTHSSSPIAPIRALFLDIDGTLVDSQEQVSSRVRRALAAAHKKGCEVVLCTGRTRFRTLPVAQRLGIPLGYAVTSNGGVLSHLETAEV